MPSPLEYSILLISCCNNFLMLPAIGTWTASQRPQFLHLPSHLGGLDPINPLIFTANSSSLICIKCELIMGIEFEDERKSHETSPDWHQEIVYLEKENREIWAQCVWSNYRMEILLESLTLSHELRRVEAGHQ